MGKILVKYSLKTPKYGIIKTSTLKDAKMLKEKYGGIIRKWKTPKWI